MTSLSRFPSLPLATVAATAATALTWAAARATGQHLIIMRGAEAVPVPLGAVVLATVAGGAAAAGLARVAARWRDPRRSYLVLCALGLAVSAVPPLLSTATAGAAAWLLVLHAVAAAVLVPAGLPERVPAGSAA